MLPTWVWLSRLAFVLSYAYIGVLTRLRQHTRKHSMGIVGHRGASATHPENTRAASAAALRAGADGVEFDLQQLADGTVIVLHDDTLERTSTHAARSDLLSRPVSELSRADLDGVRVGGEAVPLFADVLQDLLTFYPDRVCFPELKAGANHALVQESVAVVRRLGATPERLAFISFDESVCSQAKRSLPSHDVYLIASCTSEVDVAHTIDRAVALGLDGVDVNADPRVVTRAVVKSAQKHRLVFGVWVSRAPAVNDVQAVWEHMDDAGVDFLTSNLPDGLVAWNTSRRVDRRTSFVDFWIARHRK